MKHQESFISTWSNNVEKWMDNSYLYVLSGFFAVSLTFSCKGYILERGLLCKEG